MIKVFEAFSGYGSQSLALEHIGIDYKVVGISEIDKNAIKAYRVLHGKDIDNYGDIASIPIRILPKFDLFTYSFPCQDISLSGKIAGIKRKSTRSGLLYECEKIIESRKPKYLLMENVKNLVGKQFKSQFEEWLKYLEKLGYSNQWFVLNSKDFGVPQNRERVFCVSILGEKVNLNIEKRESKKLSEILEVNNEYIGYDERYKGVYTNGAYRGRKKDGRYIQNLEVRNDDLSNTLTTVRKDNIVIEDGNLRYLTVRESFRLMGLREEEIDKLENSDISKSALFKMAGNSIVVPVLEEIFKSIFTA